jgi:PHD/YefM family antitoxin component YafN of YafNO toxin-antitoxin module
MDTKPKLVPLSELEQRQAEILAALDQGPLVLTQENRAAVVLVDPGYWNQMVEELKGLRDALDAIDAYQAYRQSPDYVKSWQVVRETLVAKGLL